MVTENETQEDVSSERTGDLPGDGDQQQTLQDIEARQQVLLENMVICDHMLVQLYKLKGLFTANPDIENRTMTQEEVEELSDTKLSENKTLTQEDCEDTESAPFQKMDEAQGEEKNKPDDGNKANTLDEDQENPKVKVPQFGENAST